MDSGQRSYSRVLTPAGLSPAGEIGHPRIYWRLAKAGDEVAAEVRRRDVQRWKRVARQERHRNVRQVQPVHRRKVAVAVQTAIRFEHHPDAGAGVTPQLEIDRTAPSAGCVDDPRAEFVQLRRIEQLAGK